MSQATDCIAQLIRAANTLDTVTPFERGRLLDRGISIVRAQRELLQLQGNIVPVRPGFMQDLGSLANMAGREGGIDVLIGAGMLMLADEIQRLRMLCRACDP